jgi:hypothetical protein
MLVGTFPVWSWSPRIAASAKPPGAECGVARNKCRIAENKCRIDANKCRIAGLGLAEVQDIGAVVDEAESLVHLDGGRVVGFHVQHDR